MAKEDKLMNPLDLINSLASLLIKDRENTLSVDCLNLLDSGQSIIYEPLYQEKGHLLDIYETRFEIQKDVLGKPVAEGGDLLLDNLHNYKAELVATISLVTDNASFLLFTSIDLLQLIAVVRI